MDKGNGRKIVGEAKGYSKRWRNIQDAADRVTAAMIAMRP